MRSSKRKGRAIGKATNNKQNHKAQESGHQKFLFGVSLTLFPLNIIGLEAKFKQVKTLKNSKYVLDL